MCGDESEAVAPIIWFYQTVDAQKEEVSFPNLLITLRRYGQVSKNQQQAWQYERIGLICLTDISISSDTVKALIKIGS